MHPATTTTDQHPDAQRTTAGTHQTGPVPLPLWRLYLLRFGYLFMAVGLALVKWPLLLHSDEWELLEGVINCMLIAMSLLALVGLRYPVKMLPLLLFETAWKLIWLTVVALPLRISGPLDPANLRMTTDLLYVVIIIAVIPWRYVAIHFLRERGDRWRNTAPETTADSTDTTIAAPANPDRKPAGPAVDRAETSPDSDPATTRR